MVTIGGTFEDDSGTPQSGAVITVLNDDNDPPTVIGTATTDSEGSWSLDVPSDTTVHCLAEWEDGSNTQYRMESKPFIAVEGGDGVPGYIEEKGVLWLPTDEGEGSTAADALGNGHDATIEGATWISGNWIGGTTLEYDGTDDYGYVPHHEDLNVGSGDFTIAASVTTTASTTATVGIAVKYRIGGTVTPHYGIYMPNPDQGTLTFRARDANGTAALVQRDSVSTEQFPARLAAVRDGDTFSLYINDNLAESTTAAVGSTDNTDPLNLGRYWTSDSMPGVIDDVLVCDEALTDAEITEDYQRQPWS